jgi:glycosyltransferase involved in cell wall biosynthesis
VVVVNKMMAETVSGLGVSPGKIVVLPAFLPEDGAGSVPEEITAASEGRRLIVASGYGERHYGFDDAIEAVARLAEGRQDVCLALCLYHKYDGDYVEHLRQRAESVGSVVLVKDMTPQDFNAVLQRASLYLRCTTRDGDAVAVREALAWGVPVIATDCVPRPDGVGTYRHGDWGALHQAAGRALAEAPAPVQGSARAGLTSADRFLQLFELGAAS